jgi:aryl-alcohol dehydrogenase-like predicted oxidoreductase
MIRSLEASLRALGTDRVEYLFLHAPTESIAKMDDLAATAARLKQQGKIRAWGLASYCENWPVHASCLRMFDVLQFDCSPGMPRYEQVVAEMGGRPNVLFSPFRQSGKAAQRLAPAAILGRLQRDFPKSVILCSMFSETHIRDNAATAV